MERQRRPGVAEGSEGGAAWHEHLASETPRGRLSTARALTELGRGASWRPAAMGTAMGSGRSHRKTEGPGAHTEGDGLNDAASPVTQAFEAAGGLPGPLPTALSGQSPERRCFGQPGAEGDPNQGERRHEVPREPSAPSAHGDTCTLAAGGKGFTTYSRKCASQILRNGAETLPDAGLRAAASRARFRVGCDQWRLKGLRPWGGRAAAGAAWLLGRLCARVPSSSPGRHLPGPGWGERGGQLMAVSLLHQRSSPPCLPPSL